MFDSVHPSNTASGWVKKQFLKDVVVVLIQSADGERYVVDKAFFETKSGRLVSLKGYTERVRQAVRRVMVYVHKNVRSSEYEVPPSRPLGGRKTHFVVWFPTKSQFDSQDSLWNGHLFPVSATSAFRVGQLKVVNFVADKAVEMRVNRHAQNPTK